MAIFPCSLCGVRFRGVAAHAYIFRADDSSSVRSHLRLCQSHISGLLELCDEELELVSEDESVPYPEIVSCAACKLPLAGRYTTIIVNAYPRGQAHKQYIAGTHPSCTANAWLVEAIQKGLQSAA